jgi:hypothetical protein
LTFEQSYQRCMASKNGQQNPHSCEPFRIKAEEERALAAAVQTKQAHPQRETPMYTQYNPADAANRQYPVGSRPAAPPPLLPSAGQLIQGSAHAIQTGQVGASFQTDPNLIPDGPAIDYRNAMGGNAGVQNGQSTFGTNRGGAGGFRVPHNGRYQIQPYPNRNPHYRPQPYPQRPQRGRQGYYRNGRIVYQ